MSKGCELTKYTGDQNEHEKLLEIQTFQCMIFKTIFYSHLRSPVILPNYNLLISVKLYMRTHILNVLDVTPKIYSMYSMMPIAKFIKVYHKNRLYHDVQTPMMRVTNVVFVIIWS